MAPEPIINTLIIGGGPAGLGVLLAARREGLLGALLQRGVCVVEQSTQLGPGELGSYAIRSDSFADSFLTSPNTPGWPDLGLLRHTSSGIELEAQRGGPVDLVTAATYLRDMGQALQAWDAQEQRGLFLTDTTARAAHRRADGVWITTCETPERGIFPMASRHLVLATGAAPSIEVLATLPVGEAPLWPRWADKTVRSHDVLSLTGATLLAQRCAGVAAPRIAIVGGSHSAVSSALRCLAQLDAHHAGRGSITLLHRNKIVLTYANPEAARADGFHDFGLEDICPRTGRVFPLAGFRSDSRELMRRVLGLGGLTPEKRITLMPLDDPEAASVHAVETTLASADLIIAALGYRPRALPLFDVNGGPIMLHSQRSPSAALVDARSRVLDADGQPVPGVYSQGLSAGYPLAGRYGEPSFAGQANGLALWQAEVGAEIVQQLLASAP